MNPAAPRNSDAPSCDARQDEAEARASAEFIASQDPVEAAAASWLVRRQDGLSPEEEAEFQSWLAADPAHAEALARMQEVWGSIGELPGESVESLRAGLPSVRASTAAPAARPAAAAPGLPLPRRRAPSRPATAAWLAGPGRLAPRATAAAVALALLGGGWLGWHAWQHQPTFTQTFATEIGQQKQLQLPDGSTLWLDTATRIDATLYRQRREVRLSEGQVLFAVQSHPEQPFDVLAGATRVTVVGTRFSVRHTRSGIGDEGSVNVVVEQGRVRVASRSASRELATGGGAAHAVELGAGQSVTADAQGALGPVGSGAAAPAAWREGRVSFNGTPLGKALAEFERYGSTGLVIHDPAAAALKVQGSFDLRHVGAFARALPQVLPVRLRPTSDGRTEIARQ
ncbi:MAG: FecR domain-containing protein [Ottowia sp.]|uniref:FecR family protein n=1 Tax=Ottowia sp. TaxID=1898956 RepID=UPI0039E27A3A